MLAYRLLRYGSGHRMYQRATVRQPGGFMRQIAAAVFVALFLTAGVASAAQVTIVMNSGERHSGQLFYDRGARVGLDMNGQRRYFQHADIAVIMFVPGTPSNDEI